MAILWLQAATDAVTLEASQQVGRGRLVGGWEYVWAAYGITWAGIVLYGVSLWARRPKGEPPATGGVS